MESINTHLRRMWEILTDIEDMIEGGSQRTFNTNKTTLEKTKLYGLINELKNSFDDIRDDMPEEVEKARSIMKDRDKLLDEARSRAQLIEQKAKDEQAKMISDHEITKKAKLRAAEIEGAAHRSDRDHRLAMTEYCDRKLEELDTTIREIAGEFQKGARIAETAFNQAIDTVLQNRHALRNGGDGK